MAADMIAVHVPTVHVSAAWPAVAALVARGMDEGGDHTAEDARRFLERGAWQLWCVVQDGEALAVLLTEVQQFSRRRVLWIVAAAGDGALGVAKLTPLMVDFARANGCALIRAMGRRGWVRSGLLPAGMGHAADMLAMEV